MAAKSIQRLFSFKFNSNGWPPTAILILEEDFLPLAAWRESNVEEKICYPSHKTTFVCLPGPSKPLTRLGSAQWQQSLSSLPLSPSLFSPVFPPILFELICQYNADIQWFVCTSSPKGTSTQNLLMQADSNGIHTQKTHAEAQINTQECKLTQKN